MAKRRKLKQSAKSERERNYDRRSRGLQPGRQIIVACEGRTEVIYFTELRRSLRLSKEMVKIEQDHPDPLSVLNHALRLRAQAQETSDLPDSLEAWCVFDTEVAGANNAFVEAVNRAADENVALAVSNPAFEFWLLLHFSETSSPFPDGPSCKRALRQHVPEYHETMNLFGVIENRIDKAVEYARRLRQNHAIPHNQPYPNPSTTVDRLVDAIKALAATVRPYCI